MKKEMPMGVSPTDDERIRRAIRIGGLRKDQSPAVPVEGPIPTIVMPPPPAALHVEPLVEDIFDFGGDSADDEPITDPARVVVPKEIREETGFVLLPEDKK